MIENIQLENFKRFRRFSIKPKSGNIFVGPNNSGKSSILDALRCLDACYRYTRSKKPRLMQVEGNVFDGFEVPENILPFDLANITTNYNTEDALISIKHVNGATAKLWLHPDRPVKFIVDANGRRFSTSKKFRDAFPIDLIIVPQLSPLEATEILLRDETVQRNRATRLAARNFRNIWLRESSEKFENLCDRVEASWGGVKLLAPELVRTHPPRLEMFFEEDRITREIQWAGFGFQVWLQIHTHLLRGGPDSILVLDEPDIYLHPDLQHRLYQDVNKYFCQYFLATHATELINVADTSEILIVNPKDRSAKRIKSDNEYRSMLEYLGSAENADFAKISKARKIIFVEGHDAKILRRLAERLGLRNLANDQSSPIFQLGGFTQWKRAQNTVWAFRELLGIHINVICLFDRDYRCDDEADMFSSLMKEKGIDCFILKRKEIENYLLEPTTLRRLINSNLKKQGVEIGVTQEDVQAMIFKHSAPMETEITAHISSNHLRFQRQRKSKEDDSIIIRASLSKFSETWSELSGRQRLAPGKELLKQILYEIKDQYGLQMSPLRLASQFRSHEISSELTDILRTMDRFYER